MAMPAVGSQILFLPHEDAEMQFGWVALHVGDSEANLLVVQPEGHAVGVQRAVWVENKAIGHDHFVPWADAQPAKKHKGK